jgi:hypothetical protein
MLIEEEDPFLEFIDLQPPKPDVPLFEQELVLPSDELRTRKKPTVYQPIHQGPKVSKAGIKKKITKSLLSNATPSRIKNGI